MKGTREVVAEAIAQNTHAACDEFGRGHCVHGAMEETPRCPDCSAALREDYGAAAGLPADPDGFVVAPRQDAPPVDDSPLCLGDRIW